MSTNLVKNLKSNNQPEGIEGELQRRKHGQIVTKQQRLGILMSNWDICRDFQWLLLNNLTVKFWYTIFWIQKPLPGFREYVRCTRLHIMSSIFQVPLQCFSSPPQKNTFDNVTQLTPSPTDCRLVCTFCFCVTTFLDATASPSTYPCQWVGQWAIDSFRFRR